MSNQEEKFALFINELATQMRKGLVKGNDYLESSFLGSFLELMLRGKEGQELINTARYTTTRLKEAIDDFERRLNLFEEINKKFGRK